MKFYRSSLEEDDDFADVVLWLAFLGLGVLHGRVISEERTANNDVVSSIIVHIRNRQRRSAVFALLRRDRVGEIDHHLQVACVEDDLSNEIISSGHSGNDVINAVSIEITSSSGVT